MGVFSKRRAGVALLLLFALLVVWFIAGSDGASGDAEWLSSRPVMRSRLAVFGKWAAPLRRQLLRFKGWLMGPAKMVTVAGTIVEFDSPPALGNLADVRAALTNGSGARLFVMGNSRDLLTEESIGLAGGRVVSSPRVALGERAQGQLMMSEQVSVGHGTNLHREWVGYRLDVWPRINARSTDLTFFLVSTERAAQRTNSGGAMTTNGYFVRTNAAFGAAVRIPENGSVLLISGGTNLNGKVVGAVLTPKVWTPGRK